VFAGAGAGFFAATDGLATAGAFLAAPLAAGTGFEV
jgi:hypothetical protein